LPAARLVWEADKVLSLKDIPVNPSVLSTVHSVCFLLAVDRVLQVQSAMQILELAVSSTVVVVGSGPAGVELATTVADRLGKRTRVSLISTGDALSSFDRHVVPEQKPKLEKEGGWGLAFEGSRK